MFAENVFAENVSAENVFAENVFPVLATFSVKNSSKIFHMRGLRMFSASFSVKFLAKFQCRQHFRLKVVLKNSYKMFENVLSNIFDEIPVSATFLAKFWCRPTSDELPVPAIFRQKVSYIQKRKKMDLLK